MNVITPFQSGAAELVAEAIEMSAQSRPAGIVANLVIENLDEFADGNYLAPTLCSWDDITVIPYVPGALSATSQN